MELHIFKVTSSSPVEGGDKDACHSIYSLSFELCNYFMSAVM